MKPPVRMVCGDCLRSVELYPGGPAGLPLICPICGGTIDDLPEGGEAVTQDAPPPLPPVVDFLAGSPWIATWNKGSLGAVGRFQLRELLGDGGFGQVFLAYDPRLNRDVALKVLKQANPDERVVQRFFREARAAARLRHPNIVTIYDAGHDAGRCWIAYEYIAGRALSRPRDQRMDMTAAVRIVRDLADALDHAHRLEVFHRDLKPANIILDEQGRPHLTDFGLARRADVDSDLTRDGAIVGTPAYMSPEQAEGRSNLADERSDVYSLGVILFELLCGQRPVNQPSQAPAWPTRPTPCPPAPPPRSIDRAIPAALDRVCLRALAVRPEDRYPNARALADDLDRWLGRRQGVSALTDPLTCVALGIAATLLLIAGLRAALAPSASPPQQVAAATPASNPPAVSPPLPTVGATPRQAIKAAPGGAGATVALVGNSHKKTFHLSSCKDLAQLSAAHRIDFANLAGAKVKGFTPCRHCLPELSRADPHGRVVDDPE